LSNEITNSLKDYIQAKHISLEISISEDVDEVVFRIKDDGKGMEACHLDPEDKLYIFKHGSSGTNSTGLGLANLPERIKSMGGSVSVVSFRNDRTHGRSPDVVFFPPEEKPDHVQEILDEHPIRYISDEEGEVEQATTTMFELRLPLQDKQAA